MTEPLPIQYREFHDVPRMFLVRFDGHLLLFDASFEEALDDYPDDYQVYDLPELAPQDLVGSWEGLARRAVRGLGTVPVSALAFDSTRRGHIDAAVPRRLLAASLKRAAS